MYFGFLLRPHYYYALLVILFTPFKTMKCKNFLFKLWYIAHHVVTECKGAFIYAFTTLEMMIHVLISRVYWVGGDL